MPESKCVRVYSDTHTRSYTYTYTYTYTHIHIYIYIYTHIHLYIYISTHLYICVCSYPLSSETLKPSTSIPVPVPSATWTTQQHPTTSRTAQKKGHTTAIGSVLRGLGAVSKKTNRGLSTPNGKHTPARRSPKRPR